MNNIKTFINIHNQNNTIQYVKTGFQKSQFNIQNSKIPVLMRNILHKLLYDVDLFKKGQINSLSNQSKKLSFCTDFNTMIMNMISLFGFEMNKYLTYLFEIKHILFHLIDDIKLTTTYLDLIEYLTYIKNIFKLGNSYNPSNELVLSDTSIRVIVKDLTLKKQLNEELKRFIDDRFKANDISLLLFTNDESNDTFINMIPLIDIIISYANNRQINNNIISFNIDRDVVFKILSITITNDQLQMRTYKIDSLNELLINLGKYDICYSKSFLKLADTLYNECICDFFINDKVIDGQLMATINESSYKPHIAYIENDLKLNVKAAEYVQLLVKYFHDIYNNTLKNVIEKNVSKEAAMSMKSNLTSPKENNLRCYLNVEISEGVFNRMADIVLNMFVIMCRKMYNNQIISGFYSKSTRIQYAQVLHSFMDSLPRYHILDDSQQKIIYFVLMTDKNFKDEISSMYNKSMKVKKVVEAKTVDDVEVDDEGK